MFGLYILNHPRLILTYRTKVYRVLFDVKVCKACLWIKFVTVLALSLPCISQTFFISSTMILYLLSSLIMSAHSIANPDTQLFWHSLDVFMSHLNDFSLFSMTLVIVSDTFIVCCICLLLVILLFLDFCTSFMHPSLVMIYFTYFPFTPICIVGFQCCVINISPTSSSCHGMRFVFLFPFDLSIESQFSSQLYNSNTVIIITCL